MKKQIVPRKQKELVMPIIKLWCLPKASEKKLRGIHLAVVAAVESVEILGLKTQNSMTVLFPSDNMKYGLGEEIVIEVTGLFDKPERTSAVHNELAEKIGKALKGFYPKATVECLVYTFSPQQGFWTSSEQTNHVLIANKCLIEFCLGNDYTWLSHEKIMKAVTHLTGNPRPKITDLAKLSMEQLRDTYGIGRTTLRSLVHFFEKTGIKTEHCWNQEKLSEVLKVKRPPKYELARAATSK